MITKLHPEVIKFFKEQGTVVDADQSQYLYYPFWIKTLPNGEVEIIQWDDMPVELKSLILEMRGKTRPYPIEPKL